VLGVSVCLVLLGMFSFVLGFVLCFGVGGKFFFILRLGGIFWGKVTFVEKPKAG